MSARRPASSLAFANGFNPEKLSAENPLTLNNYVDGNFSTTSNMYDVVDPLNGGCPVLAAVCVFSLCKASRSFACRAPLWPSWTGSWRR